MARGISPYMICVTLFLHNERVKKHSHARIARVSLPARFQNIIQSSAYAILKNAFFALSAGPDLFQSLDYISSHPPHVAFWESASTKLPPTIHDLPFSKYILRFLRTPPSKTPLEQFPARTCLRSSAKTRRMDPKRSQDWLRTPIVPLWKSPGDFSSPTEHSFSLS